MKKILMLVHTSGFEYDDRIRKEAISLKMQGYDVSILANYTSNKSEKGVTQYEAPFKVYSLLTRKIFPSSKFLPFKMIEFLIRVFFDNLFKKYDYVWVHEEYMALNILLKPVKGKYIFDQHELPFFLSKNERMIQLYHIIEKKSSAIIVANRDRLCNMTESGLVKDKNKYFILNNFPDKVFFNLPISDLPTIVKNFIGEANYILMQGGGSAKRYPLEVLEAIKQNGKFKAIIVGPISNELKQIINKDYKDIVYLTGYILQLELNRYIDHAWASIILYGHFNKNNIFCEPNRFYQALNRGIPVIVGNNPPMKRIIDETEAGVVLKTDGKSVNDIINGINVLSNNYDYYKKCALNVKEKFIWETQIDIIRSIVK